MSKYNINQPINFDDSVNVDQIGQWEVSLDDMAGLPFVILSTEIGTFKDESAAYCDVVFGGIEKPEKAVVQRLMTTAVVFVKMMEQIQDKLPAPVRMAKQDSGNSGRSYWNFVSVSSEEKEHLAACVNHALGLIS